MSRLPFTSDYMQGAHPNILARLIETNMTAAPGYGEDEFCLSAKEMIRTACACPDAEIHFLTGGTQANATVIDAVLASYQGVLASESGHINVHEAGAIELGGHKVLALPEHLGKITAGQVRDAVHAYETDPSRDHIIMPGMVYISQPTEYGSLYSLDELTALSEVCREKRLPLYVDGARLAYALAAPENDVTLADLARLTDIFYIGGTKCGALLGEAVVIPKAGTIPHFFTIIKQHGALLAKGRLLGIQFSELFRDDLYLTIGNTAIRSARKIREALKANGYRLFIDSPTNQTFVIMPNKLLPVLAEKVAFDDWGPADADHTVIRFATCWATTDENTEALCKLLADLHA
ncbi:MAG: beta-eliminating lyase-related protein [Eubacterium sp.]|nr:beta-eliminating lyase-related protein [Eubacterium sp.]